MEEIKNEEISEETIKKASKVSKKGKKIIISSISIAIITVASVGGYYTYKISEELENSNSYLEEYSQKYKMILQEIQLEDSEEQVDLDDYEKMEYKINKYMEIIESLDKLVDLSQKYTNNIYDFNGQNEEAINLKEKLENSIEDIKILICDTYKEEINELIIEGKEDDIDSLEESNKELEKIIEMLSTNEIVNKYIENTYYEEIEEQVKKKIEKQEKLIEELEEEEKAKAEEKAASTTTSSSSGSSSNNTSTNSSSSSSNSSNSSSNTTTTTNPYSSYSSTTEEAAMLSLINAERASLGIAPLTYSSTLYSAAKIRGVEITVSFSHTRPDGSSCTTVSSSIAGENIAYGYSSGSAAYNGFYNSTGHRENMLKESFKTFACNRVVYNGRAYWVQLFGY